MRRRGLFSQVMAVNVALVCAAALCLRLVGLDAGDTEKVLVVVGIAAGLGLLPTWSCCGHASNPSRR